MNNTLKKNYYYNLVYQIVAVVVPILITPYISRTIGASGIGYYSYAKSLSTYFILFAELSVEIYGQREIAFCNNDRISRSKVFFELLIIRITTTAVSLFIYLFFVGLYDGIVRTLLLIQLIDLISVSIEINWLLRGVEDFRTILIRNLTIKGLYIIGILLLVKSNNDLVLYVLICSCSLTVANLSVWFSAKKYVSRIRISDLNIRRHIIPLLQIFVPTIALSLYHLIDKTMLGALLNDSVESGNYEQSLKLITIATTIITSFGTVMAPRVSSLYSEKKTESIRENIRGAFNVVWLFALPMACGFFLIAQIIVPWFFGKGFEKVTDILRIFSLIVVPIGMKNVFGAQYLVATKKQNKYTMAVLTGLIINVIFNAILIPIYKSIGATIASVISEVAIVIMLFVIVRKEFTVVDVFSGIWKKIIATIAMGIGVYFALKYCKPRMIDTIITILLAIVIYFSVLLLLKDETTLSFLSKRSK